MEDGVSGWGRLGSAVLCKQLPRIIIDLKDLVPSLYYRFLTYVGTPRSKMLLASIRVLYLFAYLP